MSDNDSSNCSMRIEAPDPGPVWPAPTPVAVSADASLATEQTGRSLAPLTPADSPAVVETVELREEIEETRAELSATLDAIQERLNPQHLVEQAKEAAQETTEHLVEQAKHAAHDAAADLVEGAKETVREATIGRVEHMASSITDTAKGVVDSVTDTAKGVVDSVAGTHSDAAGGVTGTYVGTPINVTGGDTARGAGSTIWGTIKENPIPTALAAASLGWLFAHRANSAATRRASQQTSYPSSSRQPSSSYQQPSYGEQDTVRVTGSAPGATQNTAGHMVDQAQDKAGQVAGQARNTVGNAVDQVQDKAGQVAGQAQQTASGLLHGTQDAVGGLAQGAQNTVGGLAQGTQETVGGLVQGTQQTAQQAQGQFQRLLQENPLAAGAAAVALGTAIGLIIPETQRESQLMGGARDTVVDRAMGTAQDTMQKVGTIAQKAESAAESAVKEEAHAQGLVGSQQ